MLLRNQILTTLPADDSEVTDVQSKMLNCHFYLGIHDVSY